ncbi:unnamed protein product [Trifolium pratense]|uniref:Uncharacterized protein n=1 Tax=Trifolium pratense TaxID=57577 RepID=A0ACB0LMR5_TRIPR|nr:unnamed protein product [Trifolium pratense]
MEVVAHLHKKKIRHLNITPDNILLFGDGESGVTAKLANFTFYHKSDRLLSVNDGTTGFRCPERLLGQPEGFTSDVFSVALVTAHVISGGNHPYEKTADVEQCEENIKLGKRYKRFTDTLSEIAVDFLKDMLAPDPTQRPEIKTMLQHPLLWDKEKRADFLCEVNNMLQELPVNSAEVVHLDSFNNDVITDWVYDGWLDRFHHDFLNEVTFQNNGFKYRWFELRELFRAYEYLLDELPKLILISYEIVKQGNHAESDRFKRFFKEVCNRKDIGCMVGFCLSNEITVHANLEIISSLFASTKN